MAILEALKGWFNKSPKSASVILAVVIKLLHSWKKSNLSLRTGIYNFLGLDKVSGEALVKLAYAFWLKGESKIKSRAYNRLIIAISILVFRGKISQWLSNSRREQITIMFAGGNGSEMLHGFLKYALASVLLSIQNKLYLKMRRELNLTWIHNLTTSFLQSFTKQCLSRKKAEGQDENSLPEQRIAEDIRVFVKLFTMLGFQFIQAAITLYFNISILLSISPLLSTGAVVSALLGTWSTLYVARPLGALYAKERQTKGDFRYTLTRMRENGDSIAFYHGEEQEVAQVTDKLNLLHRSEHARLSYKDGIQLFTSIYTHLAGLVPILLLTPNGLISGAGGSLVGVVNQAREAFEQVLSALLLIANNTSDLTRLRHLARQLSLESSDSFTSIATDPTSSLSPLVVLYENTEQLDEKQDKKQCWLNVQNVSISSSPSSSSSVALNSDENSAEPTSTKLINNLTFQAPSQGGLLITGESGVGKTTLLKAIAGLWQNGTGIIQFYNTSSISTSASLFPSDVLFLPQRPYNQLGSLRQQLFYPFGSSLREEIQDEQLYEALDKVGLGQLKTLSLDTVQPWSDVLSLGEQQRLAIARVLVQKPRYVILDEATSANDLEHEALIYRCIQDTVEAFISVGHRESIIPFHSQKLTLFGSTQEGKWALENLTQFSLPSCTSCVTSEATIEKDIDVSKHEYETALIMLKMQHQSLSSDFKILQAKHDVVLHENQLEKQINLNLTANLKSLQQQVNQNNNNNKSTFPLSPSASLSSLSSSAASSSLLPAPAAVLKTPKTKRSTGNRALKTGGTSLKLPATPRTPLVPPKDKRNKKLVVAIRTFQAKKVVNATGAWHVGILVASSQFPIEEAEHLYPSNFVRPYVPGKQTQNYSPLPPNRPVTPAFPRV